MKSLLEKIKMRKLYLIAIAFVLLSGRIAAQESCLPTAPNPPRLVNDFAKILSPQFTSQLESLLVRFDDTTSIQIAIVTTNDLCGYDKMTYTYELGESWGVGGSEFNTGLVLMVKPKLKNSKGEVFIATGYGLEGVLPDATLKRLVENEIIPYFKQNNYEAGILSAVKVIMEISGGEYSAEDYKKNKSKESIPLFPFFFILLFALLMFANVFRRARHYSSVNNVGLWAALMLMGSSSSRHSGYYQNFRSGGGSFGGFGGGSGFGGFGGGSFGGGGAGGSW